MPAAARHPRLHSNDVKGMFYSAIEEQMNVSMLGDLAILATSDHAKGEDYGWLGNVPGMREWIGERQINKLAEYEYFIKNKKWEDSLEIAKDDMRFDKRGQIQRRVNDLAAVTVNHPLELLTSLVIAGESSVCYDGQYFYDTDHSEGTSGTQSNDISVDISALSVQNHGTTTDPSADELGKVILQCVQKIVGFKNDQGRPINQSARKFAVHVPIPFMANALSALNDQFLGNGVTNTLKNAKQFEFVLYADPLLTWTEKLAVHRIDASMKPFVHQEAQPIEMGHLGEGSDYYTMNGAHLFTVDGMYNVGYGLWQHSVLATLT